MSVRSFLVALCIGLAVWVAIGIIVWLCIR